MESYIAPEYREIEDFLMPFVEEHELDSITVNSMIRGSIEILEPDIPVASVVMMKENDLTSAVSVKPKNIKISLGFALDSIFSFKSVCDSEGIFLILTLLKTILFLMGKMWITLKSDQAIVVFIIYRLKSATPQDIIRYTKKLKNEVKEVDIAIENIDEVLDSLEEMSVIKMEDGKYILCETIFIKKM